MKRALLKALLLTAPLLAAAAGTVGAAADISLPDFNLNRVKIRSMPRCPADNIPPASPPTDTGYYPRYGAGTRLDSSVTVKVDGPAGRADIVFPQVKAPEHSAGYRSSLFIYFSGEETPVLSWATVFCSGGMYLGYKGSSLELPEKVSQFHIKDEELSLGALKARLRLTHPWLTEGSSPEALCSDRLPEKAGRFLLKSLPPRTGDFNFKYDKGGRALTVIWGKRK